MIIKSFRVQNAQKIGQQARGLRGGRNEKYNRI